MKVPTSLTLDQYRELNAITLEYRGKRWTQLTLAESDDLLDELRREVLALHERAEELIANKKKDES
ncbi:hypothetical protein AN948_14000 [Rhodococcus sp. ADH]|uniref:hypothetical protein n=1 Tax=Rhodococcus TaxID=1827 RepID=UPI0006BA3F2E|nr:MULTISPECIES: hypothetical protein [Rhodococcus]KPH18947.1 hypothetical protein AN948_14000 [Rhodococcus sp. ADH]MDI9941799.1 hypothetical protein [Rhodococcus sp. IEGM 1302]MEA1798329.1 hypothetical protein [Rhodococcus qingshengii]